MIHRSSPRDGVFAPHLFLLWPESGSAIVRWERYHRHLGKVNGGLVVGDRYRDLTALNECPGPRVVESERRSYELGFTDWPAYRLASAQSCDCSIGYHLLVDPGIREGGGVLARRVSNGCE